MSSTDHGAADLFDPVALLNALAPPPGWNESIELDGPDRDDRAATILRRVVSDNVSMLRTPRRRLRIVTSIVIVASLGGAGVAAIWSRAPSETRSLTCWSEPQVPPGEQVAVGWNGRDDPVERCVPVWTGGDLGTQGPPSALQACISAEGLAAVVPGDDDICSALGLIRYGVDPGSTASTLVPDEIGIADLDTILRDRYNTGRCERPDMVQASVETFLDELGIDGWTVRIAGTTKADEPCATVATDPTERVVIIVPVPRGD